MASIATSSPTTMPTSAHIRFYVDGDGATGTTSTMMAMARRTMTSMTILTAGDKVDNMATKSTMMATARNCRHHRCAGIFAVVAMVLLPLE